MADAFGRISVLHEVLDGSSDEEQVTWRGPDLWRPLAPVEIVGQDPAAASSREGVACNPMPVGGQEWPIDCLGADISDSPSRNKIVPIAAGIPKEDNPHGSGQCE